MKRFCGSLVALVNSSPMLMLAHPSVNVKSVRELILPDIPAIGETVRGVDAAVLAGVLAPAGTPRDVIERLNAEFARAADSPRVKEIFTTNAAEAMKVSPAALQQSLEADVKAWAEVVKATGVTVN